MMTKRASWIFAAVIAMIVGVLVPLVPASPATALSGSDFDPGFIISDANFYNGSAMSEAEIQNFLVSAVGSCANSNCLARYTTDTPTRTWSFGTCATYPGAAGESAARIIFKVQQACNLSAKVILVTLQKEQSLITDPAPSDGVMRKAMGYGCPDTASCDSTYYGFFNQVFAAARQLTWYSNPEGSFTTIRIGQVNPIREHPNGCSTINVLVQNKATAALYYYTPYTPNAAALANLYGTGNSCSSYGNRNFWVFYNNWFGNPADPSRNNPIGNVELVEPQPGVFRVAGWAIDPDTSAPVSIHVYVGSVSTAATADLPRDDVAAAYGNGRLHGFDKTLPAQGPGTTSVCVYAINVGPGGNVLLGCFPREAKSGSAVGEFLNLTANSSGITATGWALDPDTAEPSVIHIYVDSISAAYTANATTDKVPAAYAGYGTKHGFNQFVAAPIGAHTVCVYAINSGPGGNALLGCRQVVVEDPSGLTELGRVPVGNLDAVKGGVGTVDVSGWAIDPDTAQSIQVHVYVDSFSVATTASAERPDLVATYPKNGTKHGFAVTMQASAGTHNVCAYGINTGPGGHSVLGCKTVQVTAPIVEQGRAPFGYLEGVSVDATGVSASGWAIDPDTASPIQVHVYVDSFSVGTTASLDRADIGNVFPGYGTAHGFAQKVAAAPGPHSVCAYGINTGPGGHSSLGCISVMVPGVWVNEAGRTPFGNLEAVTAKPGAIDVSGWAIDPDTSGSIQVHVYVDSFSVAVPASNGRGDVGAVYPAYGPSHGYSTSIPAAAGPRRVCAYAINTGPGGNVLLGCASVTVP